MAIPPLYNYNKKIYKKKIILEIPLLHHYKTTLIIKNSKKILENFSLKQLQLNNYLYICRNNLKIVIMEEKKDPLWLKALVLLFVAFVLFGMISMCNHSLKESGGVGIETTIKSHGD